MTTENPKFQKLMRSFKKELQRNLFAPILPLEPEQVTEFNALLLEIAQPIQEKRVKPLLNKFLSMLEFNQGELDTQMDEEDYAYAAALQTEWDRIDRVVAKIEKFLDSLPPSTPPANTTK